MNERDRWDLRGPVRISQLQRTWFTHRCRADACETDERGDFTILQFREDGSLARRSHRNPDGSEWMSIYEYDAGRLTAIRTENAAAFVSLDVYEYDALNRLVRVIARSANGGDRTVESYEYDPDGRKKKTFYVDVANQRPDTQYFWGVEGIDSRYSAPGAVTLTTLYNERDQLTELLFYDAANQLLSRVEFSYDVNANLIQEARTNTADALPPHIFTAMTPAQIERVCAIFGAVRRMHRYDRSGRRIETRSQMDVLGRDIKTMSYNHHGDQVTEVSEHEEREYGMDDEGQLTDVPTKQTVSRSEARFSYQYDANGNWLRKTVEARASTEQEFTESSVERRTIEYFGLTQI